MAQSRAEPLAPVAQPLAAASAGAAAIQASDTAGTRPQAAFAADTLLQPSAARPAALTADALPAQAALGASSQSTAIAASANPANTQVNALAPVATSLNATASLSSTTATSLSTTAAQPIATLPAPQAIALTAPSIETTTPTAPAPDPVILGAVLGQRTAPTVPDSQNTLATQPRPVSAPLSTVVGQRTAPTVADSQNTTASQPQSDLAALSKTLGQRTAPSAPDSQSSTAQPLPALAGKAALAWSGDEDTAVSATSLAAIAAFTQAGDLAAASAEVRDGITGILASVPCARLQTTFLPDTGQLELRGHIPEDGLRGPVLAALQEQVGDAIALSDQLLILPRPQCGALAGIAGVGLPQSTEQLTDPAVIGEDGFARTYTYVDGERLRLDLTAPDYGAYIYMDYFVADGSVIHLQPNDIVPLTFAPAKSAQSVGREFEGQPYLELIVSAPFGQEIAAAFASNVPLYEGTRPIQEPAEAYLEFLKERVAIARASNPDFKGEWVYFFISTQAR